MNNERNNQDWLKDFQSFMQSETANPPHVVSDAVLGYVRSELNPSLKVVSAKLFALHAVGAALVTLFCPQLGVGPIFGEHGIMHFFMHFGPVVCAGICGAIFLGVSAALAATFLSLEEFRLANRYRFLSVTLLVAISFSGLMLAGGQADQMSYAFWIMGAVIAGWLSMKFGLFLRLHWIHPGLRLR